MTIRRFILHTIIITELVASSWATAANPAAAPKPKDAEDWVTLDQFMGTTSDAAKALSPAEPAHPASKILPSLNIRSADPPPSPTPLPQLGFAGLPPLFERPATLPIEIKGTKSRPNQPTRPDVLIEPGKDVLSTQSCGAAPQAEATKPAQESHAAASDRATLMALQNSVRTLKLEKELDFLLPTEPPAAALPHNQGVGH